MTREALILAGWVAGWIITARLLYLWQPRGREYRDPDTFAPVVAGLIWPVVLAIAIALSPFIAVGWLISRPRWRWW